MANTMLERVTRWKTALGEDASTRSSRRRAMWAMWGIMVAVLAGSSMMAFAQEATAAAAATPKFEANGADTAWVLISAALVLLMTPGLAFFYGGLVRSKNMLNTLLMSFAAMGVMAMVWFIAAYSIAFGSVGEMVNGKFEAAAANDYWGGLQHMFLNGVGVTDAHPLAATIPHQAFMIFQMMFFIITPALISGSLVERMKFGPYLAFIALWGLLVYAPVAHWIWHGGFIGKMGVIDFAGGAVVHVNAGFAALAGALALKPRRGYNETSMRPHNLPFCLLGVGLLWFGWYGFNAGSAVGAGSLATVAFVNTTFGAAAAMFGWMMIDLITKKEITALGAGTGAVAGLVGITPACGFVTPGGAILIGLITTGVCYVMATIRAKGPVDDSLDAFAVHGVGGFVGAVLTGLFANEALKTAGVSPYSVAGGMDQVIKQILGTGIVAVYSFVVSFILFKGLQAVMGLRASEEAEQRGLDVSLHGEEAYAESAA